MLIKYCDKRFGSAARDVIDNANTIIEEYQEQGFDLTLRQLYYQFVSRGLIANKQKEYKRLGSIINDARLAGLVSWKAIVDRTRNLQSNSHWDSPKDIVDACAKQYKVDRWIGQPYRPEVWIEKDALVGVIENACRKYDVPYFSCRGYTSQSEMWAAGQRLDFWRKEHDQHPIIIHLGDHDPSGVDMTRDIDDRLQLFVGRVDGRIHMDGIQVKRIALNMNQVEQYNPPPNPAKTTDVRSTSYIKKFGNESWELDALDPKVIDRLISNTIKELIEPKAWKRQAALEAKHQEILLAAAEKMED